ncbi:MAG TPA: type 4a pilus biogenesis protein PilO [Nitrospirota bacterium]
MSSLSIIRTQAQEWIKGSGKKLRMALLVFAGFVLADLLVYFLFVVPAAAGLTAREAQYAELRKRHAEAVLFQKQKSQFAGIIEGIPAQKDMPLLVKEFVQTARRLNLSVAAVNYDIPRRGSGELAMLAFSFPAEGRYPDIKRFIYEVETSDRLVGVQDLKLDSETGRVKMSVKLMTYVKGR